ncbi:uncharacterized protein DNG_01897 [Cephalotrichum gorgonifer]|uniref:Myb_DNA-binding domain-containing protein n=1 Tax=Cephalotrichum gorgonifer TaxID=2041049 RepID=A0AAE8MRL9_9PEZI|nr:uncharacterized protein DNG_01897 [Cephalotrichum gorgonifer]
MSDADPSLRRGPWSSQEDEILLGLVESHGPSNWVVIAHSLGTRSAKQCRERYHQNLKPSLDHSPIRPDEAETIDRLVSQIGHRWAEIARRLPGRSDNTIKNWWNGKQNRISRHEHLRSSYTAAYAGVPPSSHHDYASGLQSPHTPPEADRWQAPTPPRRPQPDPRSPEYTHRYDNSEPYPPAAAARPYPSDREGAELAPYHSSRGPGGVGGPSAGPSPVTQALELPPIAGSRGSRPRTPAAYPPHPNQLPGIHTVLPPSPHTMTENDDRHQRGSRSSRMALESIISR